jgi:large subunit ribosomal protein L31e
MAEEVERIYVIPLRKKSGFKSSKAAPVAIKRVKTFLTRHMKVEEDKIWIDDSLNHAIWSKGKYNMPSKIRVKATKFDDGVVEAYLPELEFKKSRRELLKEEKEKKEPILIKEEPGAAEEEAAPGAEDYEVTPTADGDVKIKKKKPAKKTTTKKPKAKKPAEKKGKPEKKEKKPKEAKKKPKTAKKAPKKSKPVEKKKSAKSKTTTSKRKTKK